LMVSAALLLSIALGSWRPLVAVSWARKGASTSAAILAAALMFSFVTARVAEANFDSSTSGLRAQLFAKLADVAKTQRARAAEQWAFASLQRKMESDPEWSRNVRDYYTEGLERCAAYNEQVQAAWERVPVDVRLQVHKPDECDAQT